MILMNFNNRNDNFGDQLISYLLYKEIKNYKEVHFINTKPEIIEARPLRIREALTKTIFCRIKGERVVLFDPPCARIYIENLYLTTFKNRIISWLLQKCITERYVIGISIDPRIPLKEFDIYQSIGVRDNASFEHLDKHHKNVNFTPDMACLIHPKRSNYKGNKILVSFRRDTPDNNYSSEYAEILSPVLPFIFKLLSADKFNTNFYSQVDEDNSYNQELSTKILKKSEILTVNKNNHDLPYAELFADCEYVISNRLHVLLPAMIEGVLAIAIVSRSHKKIIDLLTSYGLHKTIVYLESKDSMEKSIKQIIANKDDILKSQYEKLYNLNSQLKDYIHSITN